MNRFSQQLWTVFGKMVAQWGVVTAVAGFMLFVAGYLSVRFRLTALGISADLELVDERYVFEGVKFLIYILSTAPVALVVLFPIFVAGWIVGRIIPPLRTWALSWWAGQRGPLLLGIILSMAMIQIVMRKCFLFDNLLLRDELPEPTWLAYLLTSASDTRMALYFTGLLVGAGVTMALASGLGAWESLSSGCRRLLVVHLFLILVQLLLLPVNYGVLMTGRSIPRLTGASVAAIAPAGDVWLIWEGKSTSTFMVRDQAGRRLVTLPHSAVQRIEVVDDDRLATLRLPAPAMTAPAIATPAMPTPAVVAVEPAPEQPQPAPEPRPAPRPTTTTRPADRIGAAWRWVVRFTGITATPAMLRAEIPAAPVLGDLCMLPASGGPVQRLTNGGGFSSPVFDADDRAVLALRGDQLVRVRLAGGAPELLVKLEGARRLIGPDPDHPGVVGYVVDAENGLEVRDVDLQSKQITSRGIIDDAAQVSHLLGDARDYGSVRLGVETQSTAAARWIDVVIQQGSQPARTLTEGDGASSRQPARSHDGRFIAFVRLGSKG